MSHDSRCVDDQSARFAEQLAGLDEGLEIARPQVDWSGAAKQRRAARQRNRAITGSVLAVCIAAPIVWYANTGAVTPVASDPAAAGGTVMAGAEADRVRARQELLAMDRELSQVQGQITSLRRKVRGEKVKQKTAALQKATPVTTSVFIDPVEEGALIMLAAAEKAALKEGKEAGQVLYRRLVEVFPDSRSADVARRELM